MLNQLKFHWQEVSNIRKNRLGYRTYWLSIIFHDNVAHIHNVRAYPFLIVTTKFVS